jgi:hypothetical protein
MMVLLSDELKTRAPHVGAERASQCHGTEARLPFLGAERPLTKTFFALGHARDRVVL